MTATLSTNLFTGRIALSLRTSTIEVHRKINGRCIGPGFYRRLYDFRSAAYMNRLDEIARAKFRQPTNAS